MALLLSARVHGEVVHLTDSNFDSIVDGSKHVMVEFFAPWCGHCKTLAPEYKILGSVYEAGDDVIIADVDATENPAVAKKFAVQG